MGYKWDLQQAKTNMLNMIVIFYSTEMEKRKPN